MTRPDDGTATGAEEEQPEWWRRTPVLRRVPLVTAIVLAAIVLKATSAPGPPALKTSCTTPAYVLSTYNTSPHHTVQWSATGPASMTFSLTIGVNHFIPGHKPGDLAPVPDQGVGAHDMRATVPQGFGSDCKAHGSFGLGVPTGSYTVRMFSFTGDASGRSATEVATAQTLTVKK